MSLHNLSKSHLDLTEQQAVMQALTLLEQTFDGKTIDLSAEDRQKYGSIGEQNKLFVNKIADYHNSQPQHAAPEVNWTEFEADYASRKFLETIFLRVSSLARQIESTKMLHDYDNYQDSLTDYAYAKYRAERNIPGAIDKETELKQFFARTSASSNKKDAPSAPDTTPTV